VKRHGGEWKRTERLKTLAATTTIMTRKKKEEDEQEERRLTEMPHPKCLFLAKERNKKHQAYPTLRSTPRSACLFYLSKSIFQFFFVVSTLLSFFLALPVTTTTLHPPIPPPPSSFFLPLTPLPPSLLQPPLN